MLSLIKAKFDMYVIVFYSIAFVIVAGAFAFQKFVTIPTIENERDMANNQRDAIKIVLSRQNERVESMAEECREKADRAAAAGVAAAKRPTPKAARSAEELNNWLAEQVRRPSR